MSFSFKSADRGLNDGVHFTIWCWLNSNKHTALNNKTIRSFYRNKIRNQFPGLNFHRTSDVKLNCSFGENINIGAGCLVDSSTVDDYTYVNYNSIIKRTKIGKFCSIGPSVVIGLGNHPTSGFVSTSPFFYLKENFADRDYFDQYDEVFIGNGVWIGANVTIINGVKIGNGAIIGANSIVVKDVEPYSIVGGVPAKLIKYRFNLEEIDFLKTFKWWNKDNKWIRKNYKKFHSITSLKYE